MYALLGTIEIGHFTPVMLGVSIQCTAGLEHWTGFYTRVNLNTSSSYLGNLGVDNAQNFQFNMIPSILVIVSMSIMSTLLGSQLIRHWDKLAIQ